MTTTTALPPAARRAMQALGAALATGDVTPCLHLRRGGLRPLWAMWAPGVMVCGPCSPMLNLTGEENRRCDHCQKIGKTIHPLITMAAGVVIVHGACGACAGPARQKKRTA